MRVWRAATMAWVLMAAPAFADPAATPTPTPAGGWRFAHWGMTRDQIRTASKGAAHPPTTESDAPYDVVDGGASFGPFKFDVWLEYSFDDKTSQNLLSEIQFHPVDGMKSKDAIDAWTVKTYGQTPAVKERGGYVNRVWNNTASGNTIVWSCWGPYKCEIDYDPPGTDEGGD